jgi:hypothetical protein
MLGDLLYETTGKRAVRRFLSVDPVRVEVSFEDGGTMVGNPVTGSGTYTSEVKADGRIFGQGQGAIFTQDGDLITWIGMGTGKFKERGAVSYRGSLHFSTASQKLARLNGTVGAFEFETDPDGKTSSKVWEWK